MPLPASTLPTVVSKLAGGQMSSWQPGPPPPATMVRWARLRASAAPSSRSPFIFQLPATSFVRTAMLRPHGRISISGPRSYRHAGGSTCLPAKTEAICLHAPSDSLQGWVLRRQGTIRSPDPDLRDLGHWGHFPQPPDRYGNRYGWRPKHPRRGFTGGDAPGDRAPKRAVWRRDRYSAGQKARGRGRRPRRADRPQAARAGSGKTAARGFGRGDPQSHYRQPEFQDA